MDLLDLRRQNLINYFQIILFHRELLGFKRSCNIFELMNLLGSEKSYNNFEKVKLDDHYISYIPLKRFSHIKHGGLKLTPDMEKSYPWRKLAKSIEEEGIRTPVIVELFAGATGDVIALEGKHRLAASSLIKPFNPEFPIPSLVVVWDPFYTLFMKNKKHPDPAVNDGYRKFPTK